MRNPEHSPALHGQLWLALQCSPYGVLFLSPGLVIGLRPFFSSSCHSSQDPLLPLDMTFHPPQCVLRRFSWPSLDSGMVFPALSLHPTWNYTKRRVQKKTFSEKSKRSKYIYNLQLCKEKKRKKEKEKPCGFDFRTAPSPWKEAKRWGFKYNAGKYSSRTFYQRKKHNILRGSLSESKNRSFIYFFHFLNKRNRPKSFTGKKVFEYKKKFISLWSVNVLWF